MLIKAKEKKERALGTRLFLKAHRCSGPKCAMVRKSYPPGMHSKRRKAATEFGQQLTEKQKLKLSYGLREAQLIKIFKAASRSGSVSQNLAGLLERRLDNVIFRLGIAPSRIVARQEIGHGHILVNGRKVNIPSFLVKVGDAVSIKPSSKELLIFKDVSNIIKNYNAPEWLILDKEKIEGKIKSLPQGIEMPFDVNLVVDYYSR